MTLRAHLHRWAWPHDGDPEQREAAHALVDICLALLLVNSIVLASYVAREGADHFRFFTSVTVVGVLLVCPVLLRTTGRVAWALPLVVGPCLVAATALASQAGGLQGPTTLFLVFAPMLVQLVFGDRPGLWVLGLSLASLVGLALHMGPRALGSEGRHAAVVVHLVVYLAATGALFAIVQWYRTRDRMHLQQLERQERLAALGTLAAGVAHEINNPLSVVVMSAELLRDESTDPEQRHLAKDVLASARQISFIVDQLQQTAGKTHRPLLAVPVEAVLADARKQVEARFALQTAVDVDLPKGLTVLGVRPALLQVFANLLVNAHHALDAQEDGRVRITHQQDRDWCILTVDDNGSGFPPALLNRLAEPFVTTRANRGGMGLGLFIVQARIREAGGSVRFGASPSGGARVELRLLLPNRTAT